MILVDIEIARIQTFLFSSPRLKAMLGANSLLARTIRIDLVALARQCGSVPDAGFARELPTEDPGDPLAAALNERGDAAGQLRDDPRNLYLETGVLIRDGGHFRATFSDEGKALSFGRRALDLIAHDLPGLRAQCRIAGNPLRSVDESIMPFGHPAWQVCQVLGDRPASGQNNKGLWVSREEKRLEDQGGKFREDPVDIIAILESSSAAFTQAGNITGATRPESISDICDNGYIAIVHADGNSIGQRFSEWRRAEKRDLIAQEVHAERFFHSMRVAVRRSLCEAICKTYGNDPSVRYQVLMLGGDDLLLACDAETAFTFIISYAEALARIPLVDGRPLTIGAGIAIAKDTFPFHRLHEAAESLAGSAKRLFRANPEIGSVIDWHISSQSRIDDPLAEREALYRGGLLLGTGRPYAILAERPPFPSLKQLHESAGGLAESRPARSQLRAFQEVLRQGDPSMAELAWLELPEEARSKLAANSFTHWRTWQEAGRSVSVVGDLINLFEVPNLGRQPREG